MSTPAVEIEGLRLVYPDGTTALDGVDFKVEKGSSVCIAGPNGAGKSTLLLCIGGLLKYDGVIRVAGARSDAGHSRGRDPSVFGLVFQDPDDQLFCTTVRDDAAFGPRNLRLPAAEVEERVCEALRAVDLAGFEERPPHHLSVGEKKKAAIASVLACRPSIIALDEPWAGLDARACRAVTGILERFTGTRLVVTQDPRQAAGICERMVIIDGGRIAADGPFHELSADRNLLERHGLDFG
ncbi:ABC transporter ATP-binding protein [Candidatus Fermentibacteria bacterium]|nr:ABC transporter ATP-binding protein [Candidatus Fermentibacteria bacterium]